MGWFPEMGMYAFGPGGVELYQNFVDLHTTTGFNVDHPAYWSGNETSLKGVISLGK